MCVLCDDKFAECSRTRGSVDAKWSCPLCGTSSFTKGEDPPAPQLPPPSWGAVVITVGFYATVAVVMVAWLTGFKF